MASFCLTKQATEALKRAFKDGRINPDKIADMSSSDRRTVLSKYVGEENAKQVNTLFESKLLLKNKKAGYITWAKSIISIKPEVKRDIISKIERLNKVLSKQEEKVFLEDLVNTRLGLSITENETKAVFELTRQMVEYKNKMKDDFTWETKEDGLKFGAAKVALENYVASVKSQAEKKSFINPLKNEEGKGFIQATAEDIGLLAKSIAENSRAFVASFDNSFWGNQGIRVLFNPKYSKTWANNFAQSFVDVARTLKHGNAEGDAILDAVKAEIYSRKNYLNGRYDMRTPETSRLAIGTGEEEFPTSLPSRLGEVPIISKIPVLKTAFKITGRAFKASEVVYEAGAMRLRADIADKVYEMAEKTGVNMNDKFEVGSRNVLVNSMTGRGRRIPGLSDKTDGFTNAALFSVRFLKANIDFLSLHAGDKISSSARKEAATNTLMVLATTAALLGIAKALDDDSVEFDPRSSDFGKVKVGNIRFSVAPYASLLTLMARLLTNSTKSSTTGDVKKLGEGYGVPNAMDVFWDYTENKASPLFAVLRDLIRRKTFEGKTPTVLSTLESLTVPMGVDTSVDVINDTQSDILLDLIAIGLNFGGINANVYAGANRKTKIIPEGKAIKNDDFIDAVTTYAKAFGTDPETAFNRIFTGQKIRKITNGAVIVERMSLEKSQSIKKKSNANNPQMKLDHTIPLQLGGSNDVSNLKIVTTAQWQSYTAVENALGRALKEGKISKKEAQKIIIDFKKIRLNTARNKRKEYLLKKYK